MATFPKEESTTCCLIVPIRKGIISLLAINIVIQSILIGQYFYALLSLASLFNNFGSFDFNLQKRIENKYHQAMIAVALYSIKVIICSWGLWACVKRQLLHFKVFTVMHGVMIILSLISLLMFMDYISMVFSILSVYWIFVFYTYIKVLKGIKEQQENDAGLQLNTRSQSDDVKTLV